MDFRITQGQEWRSRKQIRSVHQIVLTVLKTFSHITNVNPDKSVIVALLFFALVDQ